MARCLMMTGGRWGLGRQQSVIEILPESGVEWGKHLNVVVWSGLRSGITEILEAYCDYIESGHGVTSFDPA